jgi:hypothetical protein
MDSCNQKWQFYGMVRINRMRSGETPINIISNSKRAFKPAEDERHINQNQGRVKLCQ